MPLVDPVIRPAKQTARLPSRRPLPKLVNNVPTLRLRQRSNTTTPAVVQPAPQQRSAIPQATARPAPAKPKRRLLRTLHLPLLLAVASTLLAGVLFQSLVIGEISIAAYALFAFVRRIPSRTSFILAALSVLTVLVLLGTQGYSSLADNFAVYAFLLIGTGVLSLIRETRARQVAEE
ncbi:MAG TPA: hypothetical protein VJP80_06615 [Candidatus Saccharimonadales bacterium]|nr:hypothetical protein [Candidatus Saccharimonadales bacterium]